MPHTSSFITPAFASGGADQPAPYLRRDLIVRPGLRTATLRSTAIGLVETSINGVRVGDELLAPGWTTYEQRLVVSTHDVTDLIREGENTLGAILGEGWALGRLAWEGRRNIYSDRPALWAELELKFDEGTETVGTDLDWRASTGAIVRSSIYDGEEFDARLEPSGWNAPGFDDTQWSAVECFEWPRESLSEPIAEPIRAVEELVPVNISKSPSGKTVVDFGQVISGWVRIMPDAVAGQTITLRHAELVTAGEIDVTTLRTAEATDRFTAAADGRQTWEPRFTFHGFRYLEVDGWPGEVTADDLRAIVIHSDMRRRGRLETSNPLLNRLHENAVWSMRGNFVGVPTDCPQRDERLGWTGDLNAFAPSAAYLYDVRGVLGSWLTDLRLEQSSKGYVPWIVPDVLTTPSSPTALWSDAAVSVPWALYQQYGDPQILRDSYVSMRTFIVSVEERLSDAALWDTGFQYGDWLDPDAPVDNAAGGKTDRYLVASAYLVKTTRELAATAELLGEDADAERFGALHQRVRDAFRAEFVTATGRVTNESATAYALAIAFGILEPEQLRHAGDLLAGLVAKAGYRISTGFAGTPLVADALSSTGHLAEAYMLLLETRCPSFLYPVTQGATTIWERWDSIRPDGTLNDSGMTSLNHYALGAVVDWMHRTIGGIAPAEPGYARVAIAPQPGGDLTYSRASLDTDHGPIMVRWNVEGRDMVVEVTLPDGVPADVTLPGYPDGGAFEVIGGSHRWSYQLADAQQAPHTMDTMLNILAADPSVWQRVTEVFARHLPGIPIDGSAPEAAGMSLNTVLGYIPGASDELARDLEAAVVPAAAS